MHEGNEEADGEAGKGKDCERMGAREVRAGELRFVIAMREDQADTAQSAYKKWVNDKSADTTDDK